MPRIRLIALVFWLALAAVLSVLYALRPELLEPERIVATLRGSGQSVLLGYVLLSMVRAFTLVPSTVFIIVGTLLFPDRPWFVMISSLERGPAFDHPHLLFLRLSRAWRSLRAETCETWCAGSSSR